MTTTDEQDAIVARVKEAAEELAKAISAAHGIEPIGRMRIKATYRGLDSDMRSVKAKTDIRIDAHITGDNFDREARL